MGPTLDEPQSFGQGSYFGRSWEYGGLYGIRSSRRNDWNDSKPERRHGKSLGRIKSELLVETDLKDVSIISFHGMIDLLELSEAELHDLRARALVPFRLPQSQEPLDFRT